MEYRVNYRLAHFEGLRGTAAFVVVLWHYYLLYFPLDTDANRFLIYSPLMAVLNGPLAISVFFVLSGYVLTAKFFRTKDRTALLNMVVARYPRLAIPVFASFLIAYAAGKLGWFGQYLAKMKVLNSFGFGPDAWWEPVTSLGKAIREGMFGVFFNANESLSINPPLWTMKIELIGSFGVFAFCLALGSSRLRLPLYAILVTLLSTFLSQLHRWLGIDSNHLISFVVGMAYADTANSSFSYGSQVPAASVNRPAIGIVGVVLCVVMAAQVGTIGFLDPLPGPLLPWYAWVVKWFAEYHDELNMLTAAVIVILVNESPFIRSWFSRPFSVFLGKISFALYLVHFTIMASLSCFIFLKLYHLTGAYVLSSTIASLAGISVSLYAAVWFQRYVDTSAIQFSHAFASSVIRYLSGFSTRVVQR